MAGSLGRGLHSSTVQLNLSALYGIRGARRGCVSRAQGVFGCLGCVGCILCQKRLKLSLEVDECKPMSLGYAERLSWRDDLGGQLGDPELTEEDAQLRSKVGAPPTPPTTPAPSHLSRSVVLKPGVLC
jgi:hypothetical protein